MSGALKGVKGVVGEWGSILVICDTPRKGVKQYKSLISFG